MNFWTSSLYIFFKFANELVKLFTTYVGDFKSFTYFTVQRKHFFKIVKSFRDIHFRIIRRSWRNISLLLVVVVVDESWINNHMWQQLPVFTWFSKIWQTVNPLKRWCRILDVWREYISKSTLLIKKNGLFYFLRGRQNSVVRSSKK